LTFHKQTVFCKSTADSSGATVDVPYNQRFTNYLKSAPFKVKSSACENHRI